MKNLIQNTPTKSFTDIEENTSYATSYSTPLATGQNLKMA